MPKPIDITNKRFGRLLAVSIALIPNKRKHWKCVCDCGNVHVAGYDGLVSGRTQSCGCLLKESSAKTGRNKAKDLSGNKFNKLLLLEKVILGEGQRNTYYKCLCDCGKEALIGSGNLRENGTKSCGCSKIDAGRLRKKSDTILRLGAVWQYYRRNCKVREIEWNLTKIQFQELIQMPCSYCGYFDKVKLGGIDRVDNTKGYFLENSVPCCRWCNWGKNERTLEEFKDWIERLHERNILH